MKINARDDVGDSGYGVPYNVEEEKIELYKHRRKEFYEFIKKYQIENSLIVVDKNSKKNVELSARNIPNIKITMVEFLNIFDVLKYKKIIFTLSAIKIIEERFK